MELPKIGSSEGGMFDNIKSKLGLGSKRDDYNESYDDNADFDSYDDYDDYDDGYDSYDDYDDSQSIRDTRRGYAESNDEYGTYDAYDNHPLDRASASGGVTRPRLVSLEDVRANTQLEIDANSDWERRSAEKPAARRAASFDFDAPQNTVHSEGLNSLFSSTTPVPAQATAPAPAPAPEKPTVVSPLSEQPTLRPANMSYDVFSASSPRQPDFSKRSLVIVAPQSYADVERVAKTVRNGDVVVLSLRTTQDALSKRLLDFCFGVASALDARVDCIGAKVFALCTGSALSTSELQDLSNQGVL